MVWPSGANSPRSVPAPRNVNPAKTLILNYFNFLPMWEE